jgi:cell division protease FtsH
MLETPKLDWNDIVIKSEDRQVLDRNLVKFIDSVDLYRRKGLRGSRGVLLAGPPGTGKTLSCKVLMNSLDATVLYVSRDAVTDVGQITELYKMARRLSPSVVILEDIDTLGGLGRDEGDHPLLGEFLNCLAGVEDNDGVVTLATTNHPEKLDWALTDRPGRFDVRLKFDYPDEKSRMAILDKYLTPFQTKNIKLKSLMKRTDKFSGAYLQEIVQSAFMVAHEECGYCDEPTITQKHLEEALSQMESQRATVSREKGLTYNGTEMTYEELYN